MPENDFCLSMHATDRTEWVGEGERRGKRGVGKRRGKGGEREGRAGTGRGKRGKGERRGKEGGGEDKVGEGRGSHTKERSLSIFLRSQRGLVAT